MDPKTANLDPKLKEAYERIMGTTVPAPAQKTPTQTQVNTPATPAGTPPPQAPKLEVHEVKPEPLNVPKFKTPPPLPPQPQPYMPSNEMVQSPEFPNMTAPKDPFAKPLPPPVDILGQDANFNSLKKKSKLKPILLTLGGLIFFIIYGVIWAKVFNLF